jgi:hypothetical protein
MSALYLGVCRWIPALLGEQVHWHSAVRFFGQVSMDMVVVSLSAAFAREGGGG